MATYEPGSIYFCQFPKFVQPLQGGKDYNVDSLKPGVNPRPAVVLQETDQRRLLVAPISSDGAGNNERVPTFLRMKRSDYPQILKNDSFIKLNQMQVIDSQWLYPANAPQKVGDLKPLDLDRAQQLSLYATHTEESYVRWISEIVSKNLKVNAQQLRTLEENMGQDLKFVDSPTRNHPLPYDRGGIYSCLFQPSTPSSAYRLQGEHPGVLITPGNLVRVAPGQTLVVPLVEENQSLKALQSKHDLMVSIKDKDMRALVSQIQPVNYGWIDRNQLSRLTVGNQIEMDRAVISALGLRDHVLAASRELIQDKKLFENLSRPRPPKGR